MGVARHAWTWTKSTFWKGKTWLNVVAWLLSVGVGVLLCLLVLGKTQAMEQLMTTALVVVGGTLGPVFLVFCGALAVAGIQRSARRDAARERVHRQMVAQAVDDEAKDVSKKEEEKRQLRLRLQRVTQEREKGETLLSELRKNSPCHRELANPLRKIPMRRPPDYEPQFHPSVSYAERIRKWWTYGVWNSLGGTKWQEMLPRSALNLRPEQEEGELESKLKTLNRIIGMMERALES